MSSDIEFVNNILGKQSHLPVQERTSLRLYRSVHSAQLHLMVSPRFTGTALLTALLGICRSPGLFRRVQLCVL